MRAESGAWLALSTESVSQRPFLVSCHSAVVREKANQHKVRLNFNYVFEFSFLSFWVQICQIEISSEEKQRLYLVIDAANKSNDVIIS